MNSRPRHARRKQKQSRRAQVLLRAGLTFAATGAVVGGAAGSAFAASGDGRGTRSDRLETPLGSHDASVLHEPLGVTTQALGTSLSSALGPVKSLQLDPLARTAVDPVNNSVGTRIADFKPISTAALTGPLADGASLSELPLVGGLTKVLPG